MVWKIQLFAGEPADHSFPTRHDSIHPRRPRGKIISGLSGTRKIKRRFRSARKFTTTKVNFRADRNRRFIFLAPDNLDPGSPRMDSIRLLKLFYTLTERNALHVKKIPRITPYPHNFVVTRRKWHLQVLCNGGYKGVDHV